MAGKSPASLQSIASGKTAPTLTPTGKFAGKPEVPLSRTVTLIGSGAGARLQLISSTVSKSHALLVNCGNGPYVRDLASRTKVLVNGNEVREAVLKQGDSVQFGKFAFTFNQPGDGEKSESIEAPPAAQVQVTGVDSPIPLSERCLLLGRRDTCDIVIADEAVSTAHAVIFEMDGRRFVRDLGSRTGTFVNGNQVHQAELEFGDTVRIGQVDLKYEAGQQQLDEVSLDADEMLPVPAQMGAKKLLLRCRSFRQKKNHMPATSRWNWRPRLKRRGGRSRSAGTRRSGSRADCRSYADGRDLARTDRAGAAGSATDRGGCRRR